ncbi:TIGR03084 family metal-binding protein [Nocardioides sp.]|uniref:TIGR03084 family metal-binding protein n=1 Tax=Nocardioides sp. TaxID=35761 RepID=UPI00262D072F|nr:TIGR03084 family metal-binding protein [Nocardioides sp.]
MTVLEALLADLAEVGDHLRAAVADLTEEQWRTPTPAEGWDIATQIAHLAWTDEAAVLAARAAAGDQAGWDELVLAAIADPEGVIDAAALSGGAVAPADLLQRWDASRAALATALRGTDAKLPWFGPPMSPASMATARLMETWAHGLDVYDALGIAPPRTDAVRHVAHLGVRTRGYSFAAHELDAPTEEIQVTLVLPTEEVVTFGPDDAPQTVTGSAWYFAQLVTQRIHRDDTDLVAHGADAEQWLQIAQAFAGPAGGGREASR